VVPKGWIHNTGQLLQPTDAITLPKMAAVRIAVAAMVLDGAGDGHRVDAGKQPPRIAGYQSNEKNGYHRGLKSHPKDSSTQENTHKHTQNMTVMGGCMGCTTAGHCCIPCSSINSTRSCPV
jgi:hypothetical protein